MNEYKKLLILLYEIDKQFEEGSLNKKDYNEKIDFIYSEVKKIDYNTVNGSFLNVIFKDRC